jgi:hypothetical protein
MKFLLLAAVLAVAWALWRRSRPGGPSPRPGRPSNLFGVGERAITVRSADNVRLLSDDQVDRAERDVQEDVGPR